MMTYDEACRILAPWIEEGKRSYLDNPQYGPGPRLWGCCELGVYITYLPYPPEHAYQEYKTPQFELVGDKYKAIPKELREAAFIFSAKQIGPNAFTQYAVLGT